MAAGEFHRLVVAVKDDGQASDVGVVVFVFHVRVPGSGVMTRSTVRSTVSNLSSAWDVGCSTLMYQFLSPSPVWEAWMLNHLPGDFHSSGSPSDTPPPEPRPSPSPAHPVARRFRIRHRLALAPAAGASMSAARAGSPRGAPG